MIQPTRKGSEETEHAGSCHTMHSRTNDGAGSVVSTGQDVELWQLFKHAVEPTRVAASTNHQVSKTSFSSLLSKSSNHQAAICASIQGCWQQLLEWHPGQFFNSAGVQDGLLNLSCCFRDLLKSQAKFSECPNSKSRNQSASGSGHLRSSMTDLFNGEISKDVGANQWPSTNTSAATQPEFCAASKPIQGHQHLQPTRGHQQASSRASICQALQHLSFVVWHSSGVENTNLN